MPARLSRSRSGFSRPASEADDSFHRALGEVIRTRRLALGLSQEALSEKASIDQTYISNAENGRRNVSLSLLLRFARALDVPLSALFAEAEALVPGAGRGTQP